MNFLQKPKNAILEKFLGFFLKMIIFQKDLICFLPLRPSNFTKNFRKILFAVAEKTDNWPTKLLIYCSAVT